MATINEQINIEQHAIQWAIDLMRNNLLTVDNSFQRNYVWLEKHKVKLIETILMGFPIPEIYLWKKETNPETGLTKLSIIDGQQRLGAILDYLQDIFPLDISILDDYNAKKDFADKRFSELSDKDKSAFWEFKLSIRYVNNAIQRPDVVKMFLRLNSTNMTLNPQELRNAEFEGLFLETAAKISELPFWKKHGIFNTQDLRRMNDIQFISSILMFFRLGIGEDTTQSNFNKVYDLYNTEYRERNADIRLFKSVIAGTNKLINNDKEIERFLKKKTHLYSLFLVVYYFINQRGIKGKQVIQFKKFVSAYNDIKKMKKYYDLKTQKEIIEYKKLSSTGTQGKTNRIRRDEILKNILE